jgi:hypothetical protein
MKTQKENQRRDLETRLFDIRSAPVNKNMRSRFDTLRHQIGSLDQTAETEVLLDDDICETLDKGCTLK